MTDITPLREAGMDIDAMSTEERTALEALDQSEVETLAAIKRKLSGDAEVGGYAMARGSDGGIIW